MMGSLQDAAWFPLNTKQGNERTPDMNSTYGALFHGESDNNPVDAYQFHIKLSLAL